MNEQTKLKDLPKSIYNDLDPRLVSSTDEDNPDVFDYYEAYERHTGEIKELSNLYEVLNPKIPLNQECNEVLNTIKSGEFYTIQPQRAWNCLIKFNDTLTFYDKNTLLDHLRNYFEYKNKLKSWVITQG